MLESRGTLWNLKFAFFRPEKSWNRVESHPLPSARQHQSYGDCLEVKREYYQNCSVLDCVTQCSQSTAHLYEHLSPVRNMT